MRVSVIAVPYGRVAGGGVIANAFDRHFNRSSCIGDEDHIKLIWVGIEEAQGALANRIDAVTC
jgi:hypothetical protein